MSHRRSIILEEQAKTTFFLLMVSVLFYQTYLRHAKISQQCDQSRDSNSFKRNNNMRHPKAIRDSCI